MIFSFHVNFQGRKNQRLKTFQWGEILSTRKGSVVFFSAKKTGGFEVPWFLGYDMAMTKCGLKPPPSGFAMSVVSTSQQHIVTITVIV